MSILASSVAYRFNLSVPTDGHWKEGDILSVSTAASNGESLPREYSSSSMAYRFNLSVPAVVHWIEGDILSANIAASNGENYLEVS